MQVWLPIGSLKFLSAVVLACAAEVTLLNKDSLAGQKEGVVKVEKVKRGVFNVTYRRRWEANYYDTNIYLVDCTQKIATYQGVRHLPLVSEEYLLESICSI